MLAMSDYVALATKYIVKKKSCYVTVKEVARVLGVSHQLAGRILSRLARGGLLEKYNKTTYKIIVKPICSC